MKKLILNIVPILFSSDKIAIGKLHLNKDQYREYAKKYSHTHAFRYVSETDEVQSIAIKPDTQPLGEEDTVTISDYLPLIARAIQQNIFYWLYGHLRIIRKNKKIIFWGQSDSALLLKQALQKLNLEYIPGLDVVLKYTVDCRIFQEGNDKSYLGLVIDLSTSNIIEIPADQLIVKGLNIIEKYVCKRTISDDENSQAKLDTLGQVSEVDNAILKLVDSEGITEIDAKDALLEPRTENLHEVLGIYYGNSSKQLINKVAELRYPVNTAKGKLDIIKTTVTNLKKRPIILGNNITLSIGDLLSETEEYFPAKITTGRPIIFFGPQGRNTGSVPDAGINEHGPYIVLLLKNYVNREDSVPCAA